jgi:hypothetical protein
LSVIIQLIPNQTGGQWYSDTSPFSILWYRQLIVGDEVKKKKVFSGEDVKANLCEAEQNFFAKYNRDLATYMRSVGDGAGIDLMTDNHPPKTLYIEVRCVQVSYVIKSFIRR